MSGRGSETSGFSLIELLVALVVLGLAAVVMTVGVGRIGMSLNLANRGDDRLDSIAAACALNDTLTPCLDRIEGIIAQLKNRAWGGIPLSDCHGDLTLENILMRRDGQIVFIDFDVPEQSSWWLDLAKLFQDLHGHWCARHMILRAPESPESLTAHLALSRAAARLEPLLYRLIPKGQEWIWPLVAFHLLRTIPYANDRAIAEYVLQRIDAVADGRL